MSEPTLLDYPGLRYGYNMQSGADADKYATQDAFTGATADAAGAKGLVPAPAKTDIAKFLKGDGSWADPTPAAFTGSDADAAGSAGLVPAPEAGADIKLLCSDGTWKTLADLGITTS